MTTAPPAGASGQRACADQRFRKSERLTRRGEYLRVQQRGTRIHLKKLLVFVYPRPESRRVGITVSSKVGCAVQRNRIKRLIREIWRGERERLPWGQDIVFVARRGATDLTLAELRGQFLELARRLSRREGHHDEQPAG